LNPSRWHSSIPVRKAFHE
jgi:hypothetical protein